MTLTEIAAYRLASQQLTGTEIKSAVEMLEWFGAVQGQEYAQTKWGLGLRLPHIKDNDIEKDFIEGKILRTHLLRPTWHLVSAKDIGWLLQLTAPRVHAANAYMYRQLELDHSIFNRCIDILVKTLQGGKQLTRDELNGRFKEHSIIAQGHRLSYIMMYAELEGIICSGAKRGNQFTYALLEERISAVKPMDKEEALTELTLRYFTSRGPATANDFATWSGLTLNDCRKGIDMTANCLQKEMVEGVLYYFAANVKPTRRTSDDIYLLPIYDELIMGYKDRDALFVYKNTLDPMPSIKYDCMMVSDGQIIGTWKRTVKAKHITLEHDFFKPLSDPQKKAFENAMNRFEEFSGSQIKMKSPEY